MREAVIKQIVPAKEVFTTLKRFAINPRRRPPGQPPHEKYNDGQNEEVVAQNIYDDLGVLIFAGANTRQAQRIGDALKTVVAAGGPARLTSSIRARRLSRHIKFQFPSQGLVLDEGGYLSEITTLALTQQCVSKWRDLACHRIMRRLYNQNEVEQEWVVDLKKTPFRVREQFPQFGICRETDRGTRRLPVDAHMSVRATAYSPSLFANIKFYAGVTGKYLVTTSVDLKPIFKGCPEEDVKRVSEKFLSRVNSQFLPGDMADQISENEPNHIYRRLAEKVWRLEREIWAPKWEEISHDVETRELAAREADREARRLKREKKWQQEREMMTEEERVKFDKKLEAKKKQTEEGIKKRKEKRRLEVEERERQISEGLIEEKTFKGSKYIPAEIPGETDIERQRRTGIGPGGRLWRNQERKRLKKLGLL